MAVSQLLIITQPSVVLESVFSPGLAVWIGRMPPMPGWRPTGGVCPRRPDVALDPGHPRPF